MTSVVTQPTARPDFVRRLLVVAGALVVLAIGRAVPLPGVDVDIAHSIAGRGRLSLDMFVLFSIGLTPIVSSALLLELVQLIFPFVRRLRMANADGATRFQRTWFILSLTLAALQALGVARGMLGLGGLIDDPDGFVWMTVASIVGATAVLFWLALFVTRFGFGDGLWLLFAFTFAAKLATAVAAGRIAPSGFGNVSEREIAAFIVLLAMAVGALVWLFQRIPYACGRPQIETIIWPALIGFHAAGILIGVLHIFGGWPAPSGLVHFALVFALVLLVLRARDAIAPASFGARNIVLLSLTETAICALVAIAGQFVSLPIGIDGPSLIVVVVALLDFALALVAARGAGRSAVPPRDSLVDQPGNL